MWWMLLLVPWCSFVKSDDFDDDVGESLADAVVESRRISTSYYDDSLPQPQLHPIARTLDVDQDLKWENLVKILLPKADKAAKTPQRESLLRYENNVIILGPIDLSTDTGIKLKEKEINDWALREDKKRSTKSKINTSMLENLPEERYSEVDPRSVFSGKLVNERECSNGLKFTRSMGVLGGIKDCRLETTCYCVYTTKYLCVTSRKCVKNNKKNSPYPIIGYPDNDSSSANPKITTDSSEADFPMPSRRPVANWKPGAKAKKNKMGGPCLSAGETYVMPDPCRACVCLTNPQKSICVIKDESECAPQLKQEGLAQGVAEGNKPQKASKGDEEELSESLDELINLNGNYNPSRSDDERNEEPVMLRNEDELPSNIYLLL